MRLNRARNAAAVSVAMACAVASAAHADGYDDYGYGGIHVASVPPFTWTGFHIGGNVGAAWSRGTLTDDLSGAEFDGETHTGFIGGGQVGYNRQFDNLVLGVVADFDWTSLEANRTLTLPVFGTLRGSADTPWATTIAGRVGVTYYRNLAYIKVGGGWVHTNASVRNLNTGTVVSESETAGAWLVGGGLEYAFPHYASPHNWIARIEYDFLGLAERTGTGPLGNTITLNRDIQTVKLGLSYKF